jgi:hypothetical protein
MPLAFFRGIGPTWVPRPVKLWHVFDKPIYPDVAPDQVTDEDVKRFHVHLTARMRALIDRARVISGC